MWKSFIEFVIWPPSHIWAISVAFGVLALAALVARIRFRRIRFVPMFVACFLWLAFAFYQSNPDLQRYNIRIDLVFIVPPLLGGTALLTILSLWSLVRAVGNRGE